MYWRKKMSPNNQNEFDIIDVPSNTSISTNFVRYPFVNDPNSNTLQNKNYKDFLTMSEKSNSGYLTDPEAFDDVGSAIFAGLSITAKIMDAFDVPGGDIFNGLLEIIGILWDLQDDTWEAFMEQVEVLIDQKIAEYARNLALTNLKGLENSYKLYLEALADWKQNPTSPSSQERVRTRFRDTDDSLTVFMPSFAVKGYEIPLLAVYAQAANLHLLLLRDSAAYGLGWGLSQLNVNDNYNRQVRLTGEYTNHCVSWYTTGLEKLRGSNAQSWIKFNRYRREMTVMVLDIVALFPNYDARRYPQATTTELTRLIYTDPHGYTIYSPTSQTTIPRYEYGQSFSEIENVAIQAPRLFRWAQKLQIYSKFVRHAPQESHYWSGHTFTFHHTRDDTKTSLTYGDIIDYKYLSEADLSNTDIYKVSSLVASSWGSGVRLLVTKAIFETINTSNKLIDYEYDLQLLSNFFNEWKNTEAELPIQIVNPPIFGDFNQYSHRVAYISHAPIQPYSGAFRNYGLVPVYGWSHVSVDRNNTIYADRISQIPAVKAVQGSGEPYPVVRGPGFTGGDIARLPNNPNVGLWFNSKVESTALNKRFRVRIRYACATGARADFGGLTLPITVQFNQTMSTTTPTRYEDFQYVDISGSFLLTNTNSGFSLVAQSANQTNNLFIDKIEFIPENPALEAESDLEAAKKAVNALFTNRKNVLQTGVTDYQINQAANLIECVSDEVYPNEKRLLFDAVKEAKRLSATRNLLEDTDFHAINGGNGWTGSTGIEIVEGDILFKDRSLRLPSARETDREIYPTYIYQKIDESRLKQNTRYSLRGFIGSSQDLEIYVLRHQAYRVIKNVSDNLLPNIRPINACGGVDRCSQQKYVNNSLEVNSGLSNGIGASDSHEFSIHVDTGELNYNENTGIWVVFKIATTNGYATLGNLELVEEGPLSGDALERVKNQEKQWQDQMTRRRAETENRYGLAKQAVDRLFVDYQDQQVSPIIEISDLTAAQNVVQSIPYVYNDMLPEIPGMNYTSVTELTNRLQQAWDLYDQRNSIQNGDFRNDVSNWNVTPEVNIQQMNDTSVLVIPNWDSQASQQITVQPNRRYVLRVTARKEGSGDGYVTIRDGAKYTETLTFNTCDYNGSSVYQEQALYTNDVYNTQSANIHGSNSAYHTQASNTDRYNMNGMYNDQTSYVTKTVEFIPNTEQVWIEMSETEGVFYIESVELIVEEN
uniref:Crystaline entomocidal protoxin n=1 Tax=Bacillus thuringiensis TaxID=1428 RepID=K9JIJ5_BACTU|nr:Cry8L [Bacillus thuringiensis]